MRSATDATRFTATTPYARPSNASSTVSISQPVPGETPAQKVVRLREAARKAKLDQISTWDKIVIRGKVWADKAHKATVFSLLGLSVFSVTIAAWSLGDMAIYNKRKRREFYAEQQANFDRALEIAKKAEAEGTLSPSLQLILNKERALEQVAAEAAARGTLWSRAKKSIFGDKPIAERPGGNLRYAGEDVLKALEDVKRSGQLDDHKQEQAGATTKAVEALHESRVQPLFDSQDKTRDIKTNFTTLGQKGGYLDQMAQSTVSDMSSRSKSWIDWITRR